MHLDCVCHCLYNISVRVQCTSTASGTTTISVYIHSREKQLRFIVLEEIYSKYSQERYVKIDFIFVLHFNILQKHMHSQLLFNKNTFYM